MANMRSRPYRTKAERAELGKVARKRMPRSAQANLELSQDRPDPVATLEAEGLTRLAELLPLRYQRMSESAFAFYRGGAGIMAFDLSQGPNSRVRTQLCGDMHLSNLGVYGSPERSLLFDVNDFDETLPGPFEWDVKRLATSFVVAGQHQGFSARTIERAAARVGESYRQTIKQLASRGVMPAWYSRISDEDLLRAVELMSDQKARLELTRKRLAKARRRTSLSAVKKLTEVVDGQRRFVESPPLIFHPAELADNMDQISHMMSKYRRSLPLDRRALLDRFVLVDLAIKVVGVGSVGTRAWALLFQGQDEDDLLLLQAKEASASVLEPYLEVSAYRNHGQRVVEGQRLMQAASDVFLGWVTNDDNSIHYYVRQLRDMKGSIEVDVMDEDGLCAYAGLCGHALGLSHSRGGDAVEISAYLGDSSKFDQSVATFAHAYAEQNQRDYERFLTAIMQGRLVAAAPPES